MFVRNVIKLKVHSFIFGGHVRRLENIRIKCAFIDSEDIFKVNCIVETRESGSAQKWKDLQIPTIEEQIVKLMELIEMVKLTVLIKEKTLTYFISPWKPLLDSVRK